MSNTLRRVYIPFLGVMLGWVRWRSRSIVIPIVLHSQANLVVIVEAAILLSR
jgi:membrane protease YdiL (CAAX protease family)